MSARTWRELITVLTDGSPTALEALDEAADDLDPHAEAPGAGADGSAQDEDLANAGIDALLDEDAIAYLDWKDEPRDVLDALRRLVPWLDLGETPRVPRDWSAMDDDELALPAMLDLAAGLLPAGMAVLDLGIQADGYAITAAGMQRIAAAVPLLERLGCEPHVHDGAGADLESAVATVAARHKGWRKLQKQLVDYVAAGMAQRGFTPGDDNAWTRPLDLPRSRLRVRIFLKSRAGGLLEVRPSIAVETEGLQSLMPSDTKDAWTTRLADKDGPLLLHPFLEPEYVHPAFARVRIPGRGEDLTTYRLRVQADGPWREELDAYLFETLDAHLPPLLARLSTPEGLAHWAPAPHDVGPWPMPHLFRTAVLVLAVLGRADLVEESIAAYADAATAAPRDSPENVAAFAAWVRSIPRQKRERFLQG